ncbi:hypothetical protein QYE76_059849 [Lolium multiflorum]|uniref:SRCR domain-containing protein n=1 Tax=Lolium multiflorum TaxID=4521 RepID=A0AAD8RXW7_LOLMU|nr:hypothetical protein QYE76_059849 [Lolium multiflorum]
MSAPPSRRRHCSPAPQLIDDLILEILARLPPDDPASLERASLACKAWRRVVTDRGFLRRYRAFHRKPPILGFLQNTYSDLSLHATRIARFVPTLSFRPDAPDRRGMHAIAACHGRVLLTTYGPDEGFIVWDPVTDRQWAVPPLAAAPPSKSRYNAMVFCSAAGCDHLDCLGGTFAVAFVGSCGRPDRAIAGVYSSEAGEWGEPVVRHGPYLFISYRPGVLVGNTVYFTCTPVAQTCIVEYDMGKGKLSTFELPSLHMYQPDYPATALTVTENGRLGFAGACWWFELYLWSWETGPDGAMAWKQCRTIKLETMQSSDDGIDAAPGGDPQHKGPMRHVPCVIGFADSAGLIFVSTEARAVFSVELKSGRVQEISLPGFLRVDPLLMPYMSFYTTGTPDLLDHATAFYKDLFGPAIDSGIRLEDDIWSPEEKIDDLDREVMDRAFSEEEIKNTIDQMENNKAVGSDGIPAEFYKVCWDIVKKDIMAAFNDFHSHRIDLKRINYGLHSSPDAENIRAGAPSLLQLATGAPAPSSAQPEDQHGGIIRIADASMEDHVADHMETDG